MQLKSLYCRCNGRSDNPLDHFEKAKCGSAPPGSPERWPIEWLRKLIQNASADKYHAEGRITATRIIGCPRESAILDNKQIAYDPRGGNNAFHGTLLHKVLEDMEAPGEYKEVTIPPFPFGGVMLEGKCDRVASDFSVIKDWKTHAESSQGWKFKDFNEGKQDLEGAIQANIYRIGIAKSILKIEPDKYRPTLILVHGANTAHGGVPWFEWEQPILTEEQILKMRPHDDREHPGTQPFTVAELIKQHVDFAVAKESLDPKKGNATGQIDNIIANMPLVGKNMWAWRWNKAARAKQRLEFGDKCTRYCTAARECFELERRAGRNVPE